MTQTDELPRSIEIHEFKKFVREYGYHDWESPGELHLSFIPPVHIELPRWMGDLARYGWRPYEGDAKPLFVVGRRQHHDIADDEHWNDLFEEEMANSKNANPLKGMVLEFLARKRVPVGRCLVRAIDHKEVSSDIYWDGTWKWTGMEVIYYRELNLELKGGFYEYVKYRMLSTSSRMDARANSNDACGQ